MDMFRGMEADHPANCMTMCARQDFYGNFFGGLEDGLYAHAEALQSASNDVMKENNGCPSTPPALVTMTAKNIDALCLPPLPPLSLATSAASFHHHHQNPYDAIASYQMTPDISHHSSGGSSSGGSSTNSSANNDIMNSLRSANLLSLTSYGNEVFGNGNGISNHHHSNNNNSTNHNNNNNLELSSPSSKGEEKNQGNSADNLIMNNTSTQNPHNNSSSNNRRQQDGALQQHSGSYSPSLSYNGVHAQQQQLSSYQNHLQNGSSGNTRVSSANGFSNNNNNANSNPLGCPTALAGVQSPVHGGSPLNHLHGHGQHSHFSSFNFSQPTGPQQSYHQSLGSVNPFHPHHNPHQAGLVPQLLIPNHHPHHHSALHHHHHHPGLSVSGGPGSGTPSGGHLGMVGDQLMVSGGVLTGSGMIGNMLGGLVGSNGGGGVNPNGGGNLPNDCDTRELEAFAEHFKQRRIKIGVTQADVGSALGKLKIPGVGSLSQSTICRFESLTLSHNNMVALKPVLQAWLEEAEKSARETRLRSELFGSNGASILTDKKRKRTSIAAPEKRSLEAYFAIQPRPSGEKIAQIADKLDLKKNVVRVWFCNQRQKQKRMKFSAAGIQGGH